MAFRRWFFAFLAAWVVAPAGGLDLLSPIGGVGLLYPQPPLHSQPKFYAWTAPGPNWRIAQWNIPGGELSPFTSSQSGGATIYSSISAEASVTIIQSGAGTEVDLAQTGTVLPCETASGKPRESDLFVTPNPAHPSPPGVPGLTLSGKNSPALAAMASLRLTATLSIVEGSNMPATGCSVNQAGTLVGIVLSDTANAQPQTMFYQLAFSKLCGQGSAGWQAQCANIPAQMAYYAETNPYGAVDFFPTLGQSLMRGSEARPIDVDLLPRLDAAIESGPAGIDNNPAHWVIGGVYFGQHIWGDTALRSHWRNLHLVETLN